MLYSLLFAFASLSTLTTSQRVERAVSVLQPEQTNPIRGLKNVRGTVTFERIKNGNIRVSGEIRGLTANAQHGLHIHEFGDISSSKGNKQIDCLTTGGHYDPKKTYKHRGRNNKNGHLGDFGNIKADKKGIATFSFVDKFIKLNGDSSIIGRGIVVHEKRDDLRSQPTGDAGGRPSCGVIGFADNKKEKTTILAARAQPEAIDIYYDESVSTVPTTEPTIEPTMEPTVEPTFNPEDKNEAPRFLKPDNDDDKQWALSSDGTPTVNTLNAIVQTSAVKSIVVGAVNGHGFVVTKECNFRVIQVNIDSHRLSYDYMNIRIECSREVKTARVHFKWDASATIKIQSLQFVSWVN